MASKPSRTANVALAALAFHGVLACALVAVVLGGVRGDDLATVAGALAQLGLAGAGLGSVGSAAVVARHWGAREGSAPPRADE